MYTTINIVRQLSGLTDSTNILDSVVQDKIGIAGGMFESAIHNRYILPFNYRIQNTITFSGTGTGTGTLTVVVNGTDYDVAITTDMTSAQVADAFKVSAIDSTDFVTVLSSERDEQSTKVIIISKTNSSSLAVANAEVNITSAGGTVEGITGVADIRSDRYTAFISQIVSEIAASLLLTDSYGVEAEDTPKDGTERLERVNQLLLQLQGDVEDLPILKLIDEVSKTEFPLSDRENPNFYPNNTSETDTDNPTNSKITNNEKF